MTQPVMLKVYGGLAPVGRDLYETLLNVCAGVEQQDREIPIFAWDNGALSISFEGVYFPVDEILLEIGGQLDPLQKGKLDVLDMADWQMTRYLFDSGEIRSHTVSLNQVLDYSGF